MHQYRIAFCLALLAITTLSWSQWSDPTVALDPFEVRLEVSWEDPTDQVQSRMRAGALWSDFHSQHPRWQVQFDEALGAVHRAYGPAIPTSEPTEWLTGLLLENEPSVELSTWSTTTVGKHEVHRARQMKDGRPLWGTELVVKTGNAGVVMWGAQCASDMNNNWSTEAMSAAALTEAAMEGLPLSEMTSESQGEWWVPVPSTQSEAQFMQWKPAAEFRVKGISDMGIPVDYRTLIDATTGEVLLRSNEVKHSEHGHGKPQPKTKTMGPAALMQMMSCQVTGTVFLTQPFGTPTEVGLDHLQTEVNGNPAYTAGGGMLTLDEGGPADLSLSLQGLWSTVETANETPGFEALVETDTVISFDGDASIRQLSAYHNVNRIHDHMNAWLPGFTGLDFSLPTAVDVSGTCNAFYTPGSPSINFYSEGDGCNAFSLVADVVFHEYGHGINDLYYESIGGFFGNGAMNEGYADFWAISLTENPILGAGCYSDDPTFFIRRYDENPKVYPQDLVGEVHSDGEIICGAWYDTHLLMGGEWDNTLDLFVSVFPGLQAQAQNGNEGEAFVEVLLDVLQADDDDEDLSNGTPNGAAILEGFAMHGISLFSGVNIDHSPLEFADAEVGITLEAEAAILFPFSQYFSHCVAFYRTAPSEPWTSLTMEDAGSDVFTAAIPSQPAGTVVEYHFGILDSFGATSSITPYSSNEAANPNLPFNLIVGLEPVLIDDQDDYSEFGFWQLGLSQDNATTGQWESTIPVGSFGTPGDASSICAPDEDHTPNDGLFAFVTGVSPGQDAGIGSNDVDGGSTTLQSESIDLSELASPVLSYWRWYVNGPASGANPGADWWQVHVSSDGGDTWVEVEETLTQDISWRRHAFSIEEHVPLTDEFQIRFVASDSIRPGQELDGGSLIEAAIDDLIIHDLATSQVGEAGLASGIVAWPIPASTALHASGWEFNSSVELRDVSGRLLSTQTANAQGHVRFSIENWPSGTVTMTGSLREGDRIVKKALILHD